MANPRWSETRKVPEHLPERVAHAYYAHGLFCSSHPIIVIACIITLVLLCCYPLLGIPFPGSKPQYYTELPLGNNDGSNSAPPRWLGTPPALYVQQVILKTSVTPWNDQLLLTDGFRAPLAESFRLLEVVHSYQNQNGSLSVDNVCLHIESIKENSNKMHLLPEYNCLILSPSNLWNQDFSRFQMDTNLINTIYNYQSVAKGKISVSEMLFGLPLKDSGIKRYPLRSKQRIIRFALTIFMLHYDSTYLNGLRNYLNFLYPTSEEAFVQLTGSSLHVYYPEDMNYNVLIPLSVTFAILFFYVYFLVRKMEHVRSKLGMAFSASLTVLASFGMTIGICFFFGLEFTGHGKEKQVYPYLAIIVGLENVFVLTKSVVSTTPHLDAKIRVAQGLSNEGWNITKHILIELTILTAGLITFVPVIQEFCIFAIVGVLSDFMLQMFFFSTVLPIYIGTSEHSSSFTQYSHTHSSKLTIRNNSYSLHPTEEYRKITLARSHSHPRLSGGARNVIASSPERSGNNNTNNDDRGGVSAMSSKRVKVVHFWARTRIVQRCFMIAMIGWIAAIALRKADNTIHSFVGNRPKDSNLESRKRSNISTGLWENSDRYAMSDESYLLKADEYNRTNFREGVVKSSRNNGRSMTDGEYGWLKKGMDYDARRRLSPHHWSSILALYNVTLAGSYITLLPPIHITHPITPEKAIALRNPDEKGVPFRWQSLAVALDPLDFTGELVKGPSLDDDFLQPLIPKSPMELIMTATLCLISVAVIAYTFFVLYKCVCTRHYADWRTNFYGTDVPTNYVTQVVLEAMPITLAGHSTQIEFIVTDGSVIVSTCLAHEVKVWDILTGDFIVKFDRSRVKLLKDSLNDNLIYMDKFIKTTNCLISPSNTTEMISHFTEERQINGRRNNIVTNRAHRRQIFDSENERLLRQSPTIEHVVQPNSSSDARIFDDCNKNDDKEVAAVPIWCIDCKENLAVLGCQDGSLEFWQCSTGNLKCVYKEAAVSFVTVKLIGRTVIAGTLNGDLLFYRLDDANGSTLQQTSSSSCLQNSAYRKSHVRTGSMGSIIGDFGYEEDILLQCIKIESIRAHSKAISVLEVDHSKIISGSYDHTLKIHNLQNAELVYNLLGHRGPVTCLFLDRINSTVAASGSQDGLLCMWDLHTGTCLYGIQAHDGAICSITYSASYVISLGIDEKICIWDRFQGHLLNTMSMNGAYCTSMCMLTHSLLITSKEGSLMVMDVATTEPVRMVKLGRFSKGIFIKQIVNLGDGIVCDFGTNLSLVKFPLVYNKTD